MDTLILANFVLFLSTLSLRRATPLTSGTKTIFTNFYPRSPCGERRCLIMLGGFAVDFYPRSPCGERPHPVTVLVCIIEFLSTLSLRRATRMPVAPQPSHGYFYPRSPCGERLTILLITVTTLLFLSTLSLRRATEQQLWQNINTYISIHALLAESDWRNNLTDLRH